MAKSKPQSAKNHIAQLENTLHQNNRILVLTFSEKLSEWSARSSCCSSDPNFFHSAAVSTYFQLSGVLLLVVLKFSLQWTEWWAYAARKM